MVWYGIVWYGIVWYGMVWYGVPWSSWTTALTVSTFASLLHLVMHQIVSRGHQRQLWKDLQLRQTDYLTLTETCCWQGAVELKQSQNTQ